MNTLYLFIYSVLIFPTLLQAETLKDSLFIAAKSGQKSFTYTEARRKIFNELDLRQDSKGYYIEGVYCLDKHYPFAGKHPNGKIPDPTKINTEHTWPQSKFSSHHDKNIQKADLHHLFPTYSKINSERGNLPFAEVISTRNLACEESQSGSAIREGKGTYFEPPHGHKGNVARAMFYFSIRYQIAIDPVQEYYLRLWHTEDPVDMSERNRHDKIHQLQGNRNPFIDEPELVQQITDF